MQANPHSPRRTPHTTDPVGGPCLGRTVSNGPSYRLVAPDPTRLAPPALDDDQQRVVEHPGGPLLVLAGPGTGKTTTLVEAIVDRIEHRGVDPSSVLALTFSRKAAEQLRDRVTARLGRTLSSPISSTFHSFAYGLVRRYAPAELYVAPLRLLSAPEQDVMLRELLTDHPESVRWPDSLQRAMRTRGFAREVHAVLSRAREKGLDGDELRALGAEHDIPEFVAAGAFLEQYLTILDSQGATDYADLVRRAVIQADLHRDELRERYQHIFVDEYQDTDPSQVQLLRTLAGDGRNLVVVGDPHQSIYGFRGADVRGILEFPRSFPRTDGEPADVVALRTTRRFGPRLLVGTQRVARRLTLQGSIPEAAKEAFLDPQAVAGDLGDGRAEVLTFDTERAEADHLADLLRRAHLEDAVPWSEMAVLVRSGRTSITALRRSLGAAGVPVEVARDDTPLVRDPAVLPLLDALRAVVNLDNDDREQADYVHPARAEALYLSPLGGLDAGDVRRLARLLRVREKEQATAEGRPPAPSRELVRAALVTPGFLDGLAGTEVQRAARLTALLAGARARYDAGDSAEEVLWSLWSGTDWPQRLRHSVESGGAAARRANRDLDSLCALFDIAARNEEHRTHSGVRNFLEGLQAQEFPADTLAERGVVGDAVRLLTAHRSKGLEWRLVVVAHVQQESWPDLRRRITLLQADRIGTDGIAPALDARAQLQEERRLFYVACTRARQRLVVTAVAASDDDGEQPSGLLADLGVPVEHRFGRPRRPLSMAGLVAELRRVTADPATSDVVRQAAARRLALLAEQEHRGRQLVPQADPSTWWGTRSATRSVRPLRDPERPVPVSASALDSLMLCPTRWFLETEAGGVTRVHQSANLGQVVHALADGVTRGELGAGPGTLDTLMAHVDAVWDRLEFRTAWSGDREHERIRSALSRFLDWHAGNPRTLLATEHRFSTTVQLDDVTEVALVGYADRLELDRDGRVVVVDLKTGRGAPSARSVLQHRQLGLYQYAVDNGAVDDLVAGRVDGPGESGGAELVQIGIADDSPAALVQPQPVQPDDGAERAQLRDDITLAASYLRREEFPAVVGQHCRDCSFVSLCPIKGAGPVVSS